MFLGFLGISGVLVVSFATFAKLPSFNFNFSLPFTNQTNLFETIDGTDKNKINILVTGIGG